MSRFLKNFKNLKYPLHCENCEGISDVENPRHHPSYEITLECNLDCIFCYSRIARERPFKKGYYGDMDPKVITISQFGEPLLVGEKEIVRIVRELRNIFGNVRLDLQTNGILLTEKICENFDIVMISLNAGSKERYFQIKKRDFFETVVEKIKMSSKITHTIVRTIFIPGINDDELPKIAEIANSADEFFLQPISVYIKNKELLEKLDLVRTESIAEFLKFALKLLDIAPTRIPGCFLLNLKRVLKDIEFEDLKFLKRDVFAEFPEIRRDWRFKI
ncbi:MAG: radical SAM protein [Archaeoglobaceae archaeon]|nr:radical SAM protein [Archaeoglobaceae archaeon]MDW7989308.1 radical SAM protein [Archaeoglobaceae archaeon]